MMFRIMTPNMAILGVVFAPIFYYIMTHFIPANTLREMFNSLSFGTYVVISATWLMAFFAAIKHGGHEGKWRLILGVFVLALTVTDTRVYNALYNWAGRPPSWANSAWPGFWSYSFFVAGLLILSAAFDEKDGPVVKLLPMMFAAALGGAAAAAGIIYGISSVN
jgi:hypothetical protein